MSEVLTKSLLDGINNPQYPTALLSQLGYPLSLNTDLEKGTIHTITLDDNKFAFVASEAYSIYVVNQYKDNIVKVAQTIEKKLNIDYDIPAVFLFLKKSAYPSVVMKFDKSVLKESYQEIKIDMEEHFIDLTNDLTKDKGNKVTYDNWIDIEKQTPEVIKAWSKSMIRKYLMSQEMVTLLSESDVLTTLPSYPTDVNDRIDETKAALEEILYNSELQSNDHQEDKVDLIDEVENNGDIQSDKIDDLDDISSDASSISNVNISDDPFDDLDLTDNNEEKSSASPASEDNSEMEKSSEPATATSNSADEDDPWAGLQDDGKDW